MRLKALAGIGFFLLALVAYGCSTDADDPPPATSQPAVTTTPPTDSAATATPSSTTATAGASAPVESIPRNFTDYTWYGTERDQVTGSLYTWVGVTADEDPFGGESQLYLNVACYEGRLWFVLVAPTLFYESDVTFRIDDLPPVLEVWGANADGGEPGLQPDDSRRFVESLRGADRLEFQVHSQDEVGQDEVVLTFDIRHLFSTRVQPNIDNCGKVGWY